MNETNSNLNKENTKQKLTSVKIEWIFGIRNDILPNIYLIDADTLIYPASNYIVIYHTRKMPNSQVQHFIQGTPHSKGFVAFNILNTLHKKIVATAEEVSEGVNICIFSLTTSGGHTNLPVKIHSPSLYDIRTVKIYHLAFSQRDQPNNNYFAVLGMNDEPSLILWKFDYDGLKDRLVFVLKLPFLQFKKLQISFSVFKNENFCIVSDKFFIYYLIANKSIQSLFTFNLDSENSDYGTIINSNCWLFDGNFAICTNEYILIFDSSMKLIQQIYTLQETPEASSHITYLWPMMDGFVAVGKNKRFEVYEKKFDVYEMIAEKKVFELNSNNLDKYDKVGSADKLSENSEKEKSFDFLSLAGFNNSTEPYVIATTSQNDIVQININTMDLDKQPFKHVVAPFHFDSIEGMDICISKPYIVSCSLDKTLKIWDYKKKSLIFNKNYDDEMYSVAYHPSGMHAIVSFPDKIVPLHVFYDEIASMANPITLKSNSKSKDIKFSKGGQFFAFEYGSRVEVWDFLNMALYNPNSMLPNNSCRKLFGSSKINSINWRDDDKYILISGYENFYEWQIPQKNDYIKRYEIRNSNVLCGTYLNDTFNTVLFTDDGFIRKINADSINSYSDYKFDHLMKEMIMFKKSKLMVCCTQHPKSVNGLTTCLRLFYDINVKDDYIDIPAHFGETKRIRVNIDENMIFTCGSDGCINVYSIETIGDSDEDKFFFGKLSDYFTSTVLIKRSKLKDKELEKRDLPEKRKEKLKKIKSEMADAREKKQKYLDTIKSNILNIKQVEAKQIVQKENELESIKNDYECKIKEKENQYKTEYEKTVNDYQIELAAKSREVENIREEFKTHKTHIKNFINQIRKDNEERRLNHETNFLSEIETKEKYKNQLEDNIEILGKKKQLEDHTVEWLNKKVLEIVEQNILDLKRGIEDLSVHNTHQIKKLGEEKEKLNSFLSSLVHELKQISEEKEKEEKNIQNNKEKKARSEQETKIIQSRISEIENKIIEGKNKNQYLEKCKFVLDFKIKEIKKEMIPREKAIEDMKKKVKGLEITLVNYLREHEIIHKKLTNFQDLKDQIARLQNGVTRGKNENKRFKHILFKMTENIDNYEYLLECLKVLKTEFINKEKFDVEINDITAEFDNQKKNMQKNVKELQSNLKEVKSEHFESINENRKGNEILIAKITELKNNINKENTKKKAQADDDKHASVTAMNRARKKMEKIDKMEFETNSERIEYLTKILESKKEILDKKKSNDGLELPNLSNGFIQG